MINENIIPNEVWNDGHTIHLYCNEQVGQYTAYGPSAYLLCKVTNVPPFFSEDAQMPAAIINTPLLEGLKQQCKVVQSERSYCQLISSCEVDDDDYAGWVEKVREGSDVMSEV